MARQMGTMWYTPWMPNISGARPPHEIPLAVRIVRNHRTTLSSLL